ncbi:MAG: FtsX-like permease family protein [Oscillospiraceae bacterium]
MKMFLYPKLAITGMVKNRRLYVPFVLACAGLMMIFYITAFLSNSDFVYELPGGEIMTVLMTAGWIVMLIFSAIFLFYTNSFLIKRRKTEFGLYNILGMGKLNIAKILVWETFFTFTISLVVGVACGVLFSKLSELLLVKMMGGENVYTFNIDFRVIVLEGIIYAAVFVLILLNSLRQIRLSGAIQLLHSQNSGEKPPKANWFAAVLGVLILGAAYAIALSIKDPVLAITVFLGAVLLVIIASYLLFVAGSVVFCRVLQKNKNYYYKTNHFVSTSQMAFRMRKNGAGLASICILCTMVLVTISTTACLYFGANNMIRRQYPRDIHFVMSSDSEAFFTETKEYWQNAVKSAGYTQSDIVEYRFISRHYNIPAFYVDDKYVENLEEPSPSNVVYFSYVPLSEYNKVTNGSRTLEANEAFMVIDSYSGDRYNLDKVPDNLGGLMVVKDCVDDFPVYLIRSNVSVYDEVYRTVIIPDAVFDRIYADTLKHYAENPVNAYGEDGEVVEQYIEPSLSVYYGFNIPDCDDKTMYPLYKDVYQKMRSELKSSTLSQNSFYGETISQLRPEFFAVYSGLFFLGIVFSIVFIFSAALIMYYKQLSEGYEDKSRFDILQKVGMTKREIHSSINSQVLTVFFLPLAAAGVHTAFAFPMLSKMLMLFGDMNKGFLALVALLCFLIFGVIYTAVYLVTSKSYYKIVS